MHALVLLDIYVAPFESLWSNTMELAASRIKNYANPTGIF